MKILVTGSAGFIGFHLVEALVKRGENVVGIDNINDYYDVDLKYARLFKSGISREMLDCKLNKEEELQYVNSIKYKNYRFLKLDITNLEFLESLFKNENFDQVVNLAAQAGVRYSTINPHVYVQANVVGFLNVLECCRSHNIKHLIYASSSSIYGNRSTVPFLENEKTDAPVSLYAATKKSNELMAHAYCHLYNLPTTGLRFFTVYGPWGRPDMAPMLFADAINKQEPIEVFNNGDMQRDFTYIDDIVESIVRVSKLLPQNKPNAEIYNIGSSNPIKLLDFIEGLEKELGVKSIKTMLPMQDGDVKLTYSDSSKIINITNYKPNINLKIGLKEFIGWFRYYYEDKKNKIKNIFIGKNPSISNFLCLF